MSQLLATLRRRPAPLIGTFVALTVAALLVTVTAMFLGTSLTLSVPAQRLAGTAVVVMGNPNVAVTSGAGTDNAETDVLPLPDYRRVPLVSPLALLRCRESSPPSPTYRSRSPSSWAAAGSQPAVPPIRSRRTDGRVRRSHPFA